MWTDMRKSEVKSVILLVLFLIFTDTPYALQEIAVIRSIFVVFRFLSVGIAAFICLYSRKKWNRFDVVALLFCIVIVISALHAGLSYEIAINTPFAYLHSAYSNVVFIIGQLFIAKIVFDMREDSCLLMMKTIYGYYLILCLINLLTQLMGLEIQTKSGNTFFWGLDNSIGRYYLFTFFYGCVVMVLEKKKFSYRLFFITALTIFEGIYRKIGGLTAISFLMAGLVLLLFLAPKLKIWKLRQDVFLGSMIGLYMLLMVLYSKLNALQNFIDSFLFGKADSLTVRFALQTSFLEKWKESPFWGSAAILSRTEWGDTTWFDYALRAGHTHNYLIETLYNFGIFAFILFIILLLLGVQRIHGYGAAVSCMGAAFFLVLLRGMFENSCRDIFAVLPIMYYMGELCAKKYKSLEEIVQ